MVPYLWYLPDLCVQQDDYNDICMNESLEIISFSSKHHKCTRLFYKTARHFFLSCKSTFSSRGYQCTALLWFKFKHLMLSFLNSSRLKNLDWNVASVFAILFCKQLLPAILSVLQEITHSLSSGFPFFFFFCFLLCPGVILL